MNKQIFKTNLSDFVKAIAGCIVLGLIGAYLTTFDGPGWISFLTFGTILLFILIPVVLILFVFSVISAIQDKPKHSAILLTCCVVLPVSFFGSIALLDYFGLLGK